jgi:hypothetical protein
MPLQLEIVVAVLELDAIEMVLHVFLPNACILIELDTPFMIILSPIEKYKETETNISRAPPRLAGCCQQQQSSTRLRGRPAGRAHICSTGKKKKLTVESTLVLVLLTIEQGPALHII